MPQGQFGNRYNGIKGAASARYIFTYLNPITRKIFKEEDDTLLLYNVDEGLKIEPVWYIPIIPMVLVNGADGIGTGWSTNIPEYNPIEIAQNLIRKINNENIIEMKPWYKGFNGDIIENNVNNNNNDNNNNNNNVCKSYVCNGKININYDNNTIEINELPIKSYIRDYKTFLEKNHIDNNNNPNYNKEFEVEDIKEYHTDNKINFVIKLSENSFEKIKNKKIEELYKIFKLSSTISTSNMVLFDHNNKIKKYNNINEIFDEFYEVRLSYYEKRKKYLLDKLGFALDKNENKKKFIKMVISTELNFSKSKNKKETIKLLKDKGFKDINELKNIYSEAFKVNSTEVVTEEINNNNDNNNNENDENININNNINNINNNKDNINLNYDYLMNMNMWNLTPEKLNELEDIIKKQKEEIEFIKKHTGKDLWKKDLEIFIEEYKKIIMDVDTKNIESENKIKKMKINSIKYISNNKRKKRNSNNNNKKKNKNLDDFIVESDEESENESENYSVYDDDEDESSNKKKKKSNNNNNKNNKNDKNKNNNKSNKKDTSNKKKTNNKKNEKINEIKKKLISSSNKKKKEKENKSINLEEENEENDSNNNDNNDNNLNQDAKNLLNILNVNEKKLSNTKDIDMTKLSLKERLALKAKQGKIDDYLKNLNKNNNSNKKNNKKEEEENNNINNNNKNNNKKKESIIIDDDLVDDFIGKKKKSETKLINKSSNKKKKKIVIDDDDDENDEDFEI